MTALDPDMRLHMAEAALRGNEEAAFSLGYDASGPDSTTPEHGLWWYSLAARLGNECAIYNAALVAARVAYYDRPEDMKASERALGWIGLALECWSEPEQADLLEALRADILSLWPELEEWEFVAYTDQYQELTGSWH